MSDPMTDDWAAVWHRRNGSLAAILGVLARLSVVLLLSSGAFVWSSGEAAAPPPGGPFTLQDGDGKPVTDRDFRGKYMLVYFGYTFCPDACPTTLNEVADALDRLGAKADQIQAIFITVDPKRDTPEILGAYVKSFDPRIAGLTGTTAQIAVAAKSFNMFYERRDPDDGDYVYDHTTLIYLVDPDGRFAKALTGDAGAQQIAEALAMSMSAKR